MRILLLGLQLALLALASAESPPAGTPTRAPILHGEPFCPQMAERRLIRPRSSRADPASAWGPSWGGSSYVTAAVRVVEKLTFNLPTPRPSERDLLLAFSKAVTNWAEVMAAWELQGWTECRPGSCLPVCSWSNIECVPSGGGWPGLVHLRLCAFLRIGAPMLPHPACLPPRLARRHTTTRLPPDSRNRGPHPLPLQV